MPIDPYSFHWHDTLVAAMMRRVTPPQSGTDSISLDRDTFDQLIAIAEVASQANSPAVGNANLRVSRRDDQSYHAICESPIIGSASANGRNLLEAILAANRAFAQKLEERIL